MKFAEELEELFIDSEMQNVDVKYLEKKFNKICNKVFLIGNDDIINQLNKMKGGRDAKKDIGKVLVLLRKELNMYTTLKYNDYKRKKLSASKPKNS